MRCLFLPLLYALSTSVVALTSTTRQLQLRQAVSDQSSKYVLPQGSSNFYNGKSSAAVTFDQHSLLLDGKRVMVFSGEFHPFRLPSPGLWKDVLEKLKASGFNAVSVYWHWGLSAPNTNEIRFTEHNDLAKFYSVARDVGVLVIVRPGPYINAETAGGGIPGWATNMAGRARTNATDYRAAWQPYIEEFAKITGQFQYPDGPVIAVQSENEYATTTQARITGLDTHMQDVMDALRTSGIDRVPIIHNDKGPDGQYALKGPGKVDLYGFDGYPLGFDCNNPTNWNELTTQLDASHQRWNPAEPLALFEWQGGAFSYWSGPSYAKCYQLINEQFANVYYKNNYAAGVGIQNLYMAYGGTNWGNMHTHTIYSSYDYGAAIREDRTLTPKLDELKLQGYFLHSSPSYLNVGRIANGTGSTFSTSNDIYTTHLYAPSTDTNLYFIRQTSNKNQASVKFRLNVNTTYAPANGRIPVNGEVELAGRESKILVTNYPFGKSKLAYSTAEIMTWTTLDGVDTIVLYALAGQYVEAVVEVPGSISATITVKGSTISTITASKAQNSAILISGIVNGLTVISDTSSFRVIIADKKTASAFWAPRIQPAGNTDPWGRDHYDISSSIPSVLVHGPYLVRTATESGEKLELKGDINATTAINIYAPLKFTSVTWNGQPLSLTKTELGSLQGTITFPSSLSEDVVAKTIPKLNEVEWRCTDSLPEVSVGGFDDSTGDWVVANKTTTNRPFKPSAGKFVLYAGEYGFHSGQWVWRGHFTGSATGVKLAIQGGYSFGYSVFLNSNYLGYGQGTSSGQSGTDLLERTFNFTSGQLNPGDNVITVVHDSTGMNQDYNINDEHKTPRGIRGYTLISSTGNDFKEWRVAGNIGGENAPDKVRGPYNEGGWWFERVGAHLPGYDFSSWPLCSPTQGVNKPGLTVYNSEFSLDIPDDADIPLAFDFALDSTTPYRVLIYVNGWQFGKFVSTHGPQTSFPIPEGILDHRGKNHVTIILWALGPQGAKLSKFGLTKRAIIWTSKDPAPLVQAPGWAELRG